MRPIPSSARRVKPCFVTSGTRFPSVCTSAFRSRTLSTYCAFVFSAISVTSQELVRDHEPLDLGRALVDLRDLRVAVVPLEREVPHVPVPAVNLHRLPG